MKAAVKKKVSPKSKAEAGAARDAVVNVKGVCNHNPLQVQEMAELADLSVAVMNMAGDVSRKTGNLLLVPTVATLLRNVPAIRAWKGSVIVFDDPVKLDHALGAEHVLDVVTKNHSFQYTFRPLTAAMVADCMAQRPDIRIDHEKINVLPQLINTVQGTIAQVMLEITQSLTPMQKADVLRCAYTWLGVVHEDADPEAELVKQVNGITGGNADLMLAPLFQFIETERGAKTKRAFECIASYKEKGKKAIPYAKIEKDTGVPSFDLQFAIRYMRRVTKTRRPGMSLTEVHAARKLKADNDVTAELDDEGDE